MVAQAVEEQVEQPAGLVALFGCPGDEGHSAEAGHDVGGGDIVAEHGLGRAAFSSVLMASSRLSRLCANGSPPDAITARSASAMPRLVAR